MRRSLSIYLLAAVSFVLMSFVFARRHSETWTGYVTTMPSGTTHESKARNAKAIPEQTRLGANSGSLYDLKSGTKLYVLEPQSEAAQFAAHYVRVIGVKKGDTIRATSIVEISSDSNAAKRRSS